MSHRNSENDTEHSLQGDPQPAAVQEHVNAHFASSASYWDGVYRGDTLQGLIYQRRQAAVLSSVDAAELTAGAPVLEIGCGAGHLTIRLAERDLEVEAIDASPAMVEAAAKQALEAGVGGRGNGGGGGVY